MSESESAASVPENQFPGATRHPFDALTGGVFSAATSGERAQRLRAWLAANPTPEQMHAVYKELAAKDKGAAKPLREKLDELRREHSQGVVADEWAAKAQALLDMTRLNIADALAWQRDAAKAGAPLSREPLAGLRARLTERSNQIEDLQKRVSVQCEAAVLLAQRIELLSTKPWRNAQTAHAALAADVQHWRDQAGAVASDPQWPSVDLRYPPQLEGAQTQLTAVWEAFESAIGLAVAAADDGAAPLPPVPVWADEIGRARAAAAASSAAEGAKPAKPKPAAPAPEQIAAAAQAVQAGVMLLEQAVASGHTKNMHSATQALRQSLKTHGRLIDDTLAARVHAALVSAGELQGWQRWSADQLREQLVARAEALLVRRKVKKTAAKSDAPVQSQAQDVEDVLPQPTQTVAPTAEPPVAEVSEQTDAATGTAASPAEGQPEQDVQAASELTQAVAPTAEPSIAEIGEQTNAAPEAAVELPAEMSVQATAEPMPAAGADAPPPDQPAKASEPADGDLIPAFTGRKLQDAIRKLREEWKVADAGGAPNLGLWKRFDRACSAAHRFVDEWLEKSRTETALHKAQREALIAEVQTWTAAQAFSARDWKAVNRQIHQFSERWRDGGHVPEAVFAALQQRWKTAIAAAAAPLQTAQKDSTARRHTLIAEAQQLAQTTPLRIDAVKALQQRWQAEAHAVPLDRKHEQKLWDVFRKPIDEAFQKKSAEREKSQAATSAHDRAVLDAAKALEAANAAGDARRIRDAMNALEAALRGEPAAPAGAPQASATPAPSAQPEAPVGTDSAVSATDQTSAQDAPPVAAGSTVPPEAQTASAESATDAVAQTAPAESVQAAAESAVPPGAEVPPAEPAADTGAQAAAPVPKPVKPLVAMRGDDRPGMKKTVAQPEGRGKFGDRRGRDERGGGRPGDRGGRFDDRGPRQGGRDDRRDDRRDGPRPPRLGDAAFRAQRQALEHAQASLRQLAAQAHGEALTGLITAWQQRAAEGLPAAPEFGRAVTPAIRNRWQQALTAAPVPTPDAAVQALLRLEMAAEVPTPAEHLDARRALQLSLLTRRNDAQPIDTWVQDAAAVLAAAHDEASARRLQTVLKALLRR
ncbi:MAG: DUF349 domain-containing protein [Burkholderiaceae bacterium]|jgi:hypothetical protein|nr:DUF349 domain-containing protein [Burkholderiaceae bacterium]